MIDTRAHWTRHVVTTDFLAESCAFADMTGDGTDDLVAGPYWWSLHNDGIPHSPHRFRDVPRAWLPPWGGGERPDPHTHLRLGGGPAHYRAATYDWPVKHAPGQPDSLLSIGMHQDPIRLHTHHVGTTWSSSDIITGGIYESAHYGPLDTAGTRGLVTVPGRPRISWYEPGAAPAEPWTEHLVGEQGGNWHGLGVGALDPDGIQHILTPTGVYTANEDLRAPWQWTPLTVDDDRPQLRGLGDVGIIHAHRFGEGSATLFGASPHARGLYRFDPLHCDGDQRGFRRRCLEATVSQLHALAVLPAMAGEPVDAWVITGKRWQAHGPDHDLDPRGVPVLLRIGVLADPQAAHRVELIDDHSGVGLSFAARRLIDGRMQIAVANKLGVHLFTHHPTPRGMP